MECGGLSEREEYKEVYLTRPFVYMIDLIFNRPFMFVVAGMDGSILFAGVVRNCEISTK